MRKSSPVKGKRTKRKRPKLPPISEEMKQFSAMLRQELITWPNTTSRPMFGFLGFYRRAKIFAALPVTRGSKTPNSLMFKIKAMPPNLMRRAVKEPRIDAQDKLPGGQWYSFEVNSEEDLRGALWWLNQAYERANSGHSSRTCTCSDICCFLRSAAACLPEPIKFIIEGPLLFPVRCALHRLRSVDCELSSVA